MPSATQMTETDANSEINLKLPLPDAEPQTVTLRSKNASLLPAPEANVAATLLPAMKAGTNLVLDEPLDTTFTENLSTIQDIYSTWYDEPERIDVRAPLADSQSTSISNHTATFFSGGVDSFYTLLKHEDEIDALVYVHGFDVDLNDTSLRRQISGMLHEVGDHFGKTVIEVETDLRDFSEGRAAWGQYHGAALATVSHTLETNFDIFIPSSHTYAHLFPWGSHPLLDPLWSTRSTKFAHDGCEANRVQKCAKIVDHPIALNSLRVCWRNPESVYNCGRCEKCMRTMINLMAAGGLEDCSTFDASLDLSRLSKMQIQDKNTRAHAGENLSTLRRDGRHPEIVRALESALSPPSFYKRTLQVTRSKVSNLLRATGVRDHVANFISKVGRFMQK